MAPTPVLTQDPVADKIALYFPQIQFPEYFISWKNAGDQLAPLFRTTTEEYCIPRIVLGMRDIPKNPPTDKPVDPFQTFQNQFRPDEQYHQQSIDLLQRQLTSVPRNIIENAFRNNRYSYVLTGIYLFSNVDLENNTFAGQPYEPNTDQPPEELPDDRFDHQLLQEKYISEDADQSELYNNSKINQEASFECPPIDLPPPLNEPLPPYPNAALPAPIPLPLPANLPQDQQVRMVGGGYAAILCRGCGHYEFGEYVAACTSQDINHSSFCHTCLHDRIVSACPALAQQNPPVNPDGLRYDEYKTRTIPRVTCPQGHAFDPKVILLHTTPRERAIIRGVPLASQFPVSTVYAGVCARCYFPLRPTWLHPNEWRCQNSNCTCCYYLDAPGER